jgi:hypothetical protein
MNLAANTHGSCIPDNSGEVILASAGFVGGFFLTAESLQSADYSS